MRITSLLLFLLLAGAPLLAQQQHAHTNDERLGKVHFATSCAPRVTSEFDRAIALLHSFEFGSAIRGFSDVLASDSTCAMAYWGIALSRWTNPFVVNVRTPAQLHAGQEAVARASALGGSSTERERGYIAAVAQLYADGLDQRARVVAYERAMDDLVRRQPNDTEAMIFHALALAQSALPTDKTFANQLKAGEILERLWPTQPNHPGLAHYIIHSYDYPPLADKARAAAQRYAEIAPSAAHALHMPSHTFTRVGMWRESVNTNGRSYDAALAMGAIAEALHASDYAMYATLQMRDDTAARRILARLPALRARFDVNAVVGAAPGSAGVFALAAIPARWAIERRAWTEAAALEPNPSDYQYAEAITHFVRALGAAHLRQLDKARASIAALGVIRDTLQQQREPYWAEQVAIQQLGASAWLAFAERDTARALELMRQAATREDDTEKSAVTPGPVAPARELLGDMLLELGRPRDALVEYRATIGKEPNRYRALMGAKRAAAAARDRAAEADYSAQLRRLTGGVGGAE